MVLLRRRCTKSDHKLLTHFIRSRMCAYSSDHCMVSNKHPVLGTPSSIALSLVRASPKVKQMHYHILVEVKLIIISLYVDNFILTNDEQLIISCKIIWNEGHGSHAILPWDGSVGRRRGTICLSRQVCKWDIVDIFHRQLQTHGVTSSN